jgi:hypothetical protein
MLSGGNGQKPTRDGAQNLRKPRIAIFTKSSLMRMILFDDDDVFQAGLEGDPAAPGEPRTPPGPLHPPSSPDMEDTNSKRQATR